MELCERDGTLNRSTLEKEVFSLRLNMYRLNGLDVSMDRTHFKSRRIDFRVGDTHVHDARNFHNK